MNSKWSEEGGREKRMELDRNDSSILYSFLNTCKSLPDSTNAQDFRGSCKPANGDNMLCHRLQMLMLGTPSRVRSGAAICHQHSYSCKKKKNASRWYVLLWSNFKFPHHSLSSRTCDPGPGLVQTPPDAAKGGFMTRELQAHAWPGALWRWKPSKNAQARYRLSFLGTGTWRQSRARGPGGPTPSCTASLSSSLTVPRLLPRKCTLLWNYFISEKNQLK